MTTDTEHTYGFYLLVHNRVRRDIADNRIAQHKIKHTNQTHTEMQELIKKYQSNKKSSGNMRQIITHNQAISKRLASEFSTLQSESDILKAHLNNHDDVAGQAYDAAYATPQQTCIAPKNIIQRALKFLAQYTK